MESQNRPKLDYLQKNRYTVPLCNDTENNNNDNSNNINDNNDAICVALFKFKLFINI